MKLSVLSKSIFSYGDAEDREILGVTDRSDGVSPGSLFVAIKGNRRDGHSFLTEALVRGASAALVSDPALADGKNVFFVSDTRRAFALLCGRFYGSPAEGLTMVGITGTNGKTSTAYLLEHCLRSCGCKTGLIGTVAVHDGEGVRESSLTTPDPSLLHRILSEMVRNGCSHAVMEVSSQSLDQSRVAGIEFALGVFTNLSVDHLDYHGSMQAYRDAKLRLFSQSKVGLVNLDSDYAAPFFEFPSVKAFSATRDAEFCAERIRMTGEGVFYTQRSPSGRRDVFLPVWGRFSVYNSLCALAAAELLGFNADRCAASLSTFPGVRGRLESVGAGLPFRMFLDYAHTPDGLENVLCALRETSRGRILLVFGCGGDRDRGKRAQMGAVASRYADEVIVTSDNPRSEDPKEIIQQITEGVDAQRCRVVPDRTQAIRTAIRLAMPGDTVLLAGKGHETWQIFSDRVVHYDEREIVGEILKEEGY